jgi:hypothetical protein
MPDRYVILTNEVVIDAMWCGVVAGLKNASHVYGGFVLRLVSA